jgi:hypothetical protein
MFTQQRGNRRKPFNRPARSPPDVPQRDRPVRGIVWQLGRVGESVIERSVGANACDAIIAVELPGRRPKWRFGIGRVGVKVLIGVELFVEGYVAASDGEGVTQKGVGEIGDGGLPPKIRSTRCESFRTLA